MNQTENYQTFFRRLEKDSPILKSKSNQYLHCSNYQRENLFSLIEFLTLVKKSYSLNDILFVYMDEHTNINMSIIYSLFSELEYLIVNPDQLKGKIDILKKDNVKVLFANYQDDTYLKIKEMNKKEKKIIFYSSLQYQNLDKNEILTKLLNQELWCNQLESIAYFIRFCIPKTDLSSISYLKGNIFVPIYYPDDIYIFHLINIGKNNEKEEYLLDKIQEQLQYYYHENQKKFKYKKSSLLKYNLLGYNDSYESVCEYYILYQYFQEENKNNKNIDFQIIQLLFYIQRYYLDILQTNRISCSFHNSMKYIEDDIINNNNNNMKEKNKQIDKLFIFFIQKIYDLKIQIHHFKNGILLKKDEYLFQIELAIDIINKMIDDMKRFLNLSIVKKNKRTYIMNKIINENEKYLKFFITKDEELTKEEENINENKQEYLHLILMERLEKLKEENPMEHLIIDKQDYFFL